MLPGCVVGKFAASTSKDDFLVLHSAGQCCNDENCKHNHAKKCGRQSRRRRGPTAQRSPGQPKRQGDKELTDEPEINCLERALVSGPAALAASLIVVLISVAAFVAMGQVTDVSQREVARQLDTLARIF